jgi:aromatic-L-amino-acid decarboxylase
MHAGRLLDASKLPEITGQRRMEGVTMDLAEFTAWSKRIADWSADYLRTLRNRPVRPRTAPGDVIAALPVSPPEDAEPMERIFADFERIVPDAMTHWQHPRFFAYFPANAAPASMLAEQLANTMAAQCMLWQTSPAATEMETRMIDWMRQAVGLPEGWRGVIQDSASSATLSAIMTMRERALDWRGIRSGLAGEAAPRIYASAQTHSSVDKACWVAGIGQDNLVKIPTRTDHGMDPDALRKAIAADRAAGHRDLRWRHLDRRLRPRGGNRVRGRRRRPIYSYRCSLGRFCHDLQ